MGCGCGSVGLARGLAVLGILVSGVCIAPVAYAYFGPADLSILLPFMRPVQDKLRDEFEKKAITKTSFEDLQSLLDGVANNVGIGSLVVVVVASANVFVDVLLLVGACCRTRCLLLPWLILSMLELVVLGCPTVIFFSLLGVYLLRQGLFIPAVFSFSAPTLLVLIAMACWLTVLAAYWALGRRSRIEEEEAGGRGEAEVQPLIQEHPHVSHQYNLGQYPQYYPQQQQIQQGPSAPPQVSPTDKNNPHLYPTLPVA